jgi:hypothetical protein
MDFIPVPFKIAEPHQDQMYYYCGDEKPTDVWAKELIELAAITDIDNVIVV